MIFAQKLSRHRIHDPCFVYRGVTSRSVATHVKQPPRRLRIEKSCAPACSVLPLSGEPDLASAEQLEQRVVTALRAHRRRPVIDLAEVQFIDCAGLNALLRPHERAGYGSQPLIVRNVPPQAQRLFELVQVADRFAIE